MLGFPQVFVGILQRCVVFSSAFQYFSLENLQKSENQQNYPGNLRKKWKTQRKPVQRLAALHGRLVFSFNLTFFARLYSGPPCGPQGPLDGPCKAPTTPL